MTVRFLDTNILLRHLTQDEKVQSPQCTALIARIESGEIQVRITDTVVFETVYTLERTYRVSKADIFEHLLPLIELPNVTLPGKRTLRLAFELYLDRNLPFGDAFHAATMQRLGISEVITYDRDFDRIPGIARVEPALVP